MPSFVLLLENGPGKSGTDKYRNRSWVNGNDGRLFDRQGSSNGFLGSMNDGCALGFEISFEAIEAIEIAPATQDQFMYKVHLTGKNRLGGLSEIHIGTRTVKML